MATPATDPTKMTRDELIAACRRLHISPKGGLSRASKADLINWVQMNRKRIDDYAARVKPWKLCEVVDRRAIGAIEHDMERSRIDNDYSYRQQIAEIEAAPQERMIAEFATREEAEQAAADRNRHARRGFRYTVDYVDASLADLRMLD